MANYTVLYVTTNDQLNDALSIRHQVFVKEQHVPPQLEIDEHENESEHFVAYAQNQTPVGAGRLRPLSQTEAKVERICVAQSERGQGLGEQIMQKVESMAKEKKIQKLVLNAQDHAIHFYERIEYETISEPFEEAGIMHVKMKKEL